MCCELECLKVCLQDGLFLFLVLQCFNQYTAVLVLCLRQLVCSWSHVLQLYTLCTDCVVTEGVCLCLEWLWLRLWAAMAWHVINCHTLLQDLEVSWAESFSLANIRVRILQYQQTFTFQLQANVVHTEVNETRKVHISYVLLPCTCNNKTHTK